MDLRLYQLYRLFKNSLWGNMNFYQLYRTLSTVCIFSMYSLRIVRRESLVKSCSLLFVQVENLKCFAFCVDHHLILIELMNYDFIENELHTYHNYKWNRRINNNKLLDTLGVY